MNATRVVAITLVLALGLAASPVAMTASAHHACHEDLPCYPHVDPPSPKDLIWCLILAQPPWACV